MKPLFRFDYSLTGPVQMREVSSLADVSMSGWTPTADPTRIPEVRHNIKLIADSCKTELEGLAREAKSQEERKKWIQAEDSRLRKKVEVEADRGFEFFFDVVRY